MNKKYKIIYLSLFALLMAAACKKSEELIYEKDFTGLNIWLGANPQKQDSLIYNFAFKSLNEVDTITFSVRLTGLPVAQDREFKLKAIGGDTTRIKEGINYVFPKYILKAGEYQGVYYILVKRSSAFKTPGNITFGLAESDVFKKGITERSDLKVVLKEEFSKPANWDVDPLPYFRLAAFFGTYSNVKFQFITTVIGRAPVFKVRYSGVLVPPEEVSYTQGQYWQAKCKTELIIYNAANPGQPLRNENNELITFP